jgi:hypothetical protein
MHSGANAGTRRSVRGWAIAVVGLVGLSLLWVDHRTHLLGVIPYLVLLACPLMHLLHRGHRRTGGGNHPRA